MKLQPDFNYLYLVRHSNAENPLSGQHSDFDRKLTQQGIERAHSLGNQLADQRAPIAKIITSSANRTQTTASILAEHLNLSTTQIAATDILYNANSADILSTISDSPHKHPQHLCIVGHNPGISEISSYLSERSHFSMAPCTAVILAFPSTDWRVVTKGMGQEIGVFCP